MERAEAKREYLVQPSFDEALQELHEQIVGCEERLQELWDTVACEMRVEKGRVLKLDQGLDGGFVFRVTNKVRLSLRIEDKASFFRTKRLCYRRHCMYRVVGSVHGARKIDL